MPRKTTAVRSVLSYTICHVVLGCGSVGSTGADNAPSGVDVARSSLARDTAPSTANVGPLSTNNRAFGFDLYHELIGKERGTNLVVSPHSVSTALAMTYSGARTTTESEMKAVLHFELPQKELHEAFNALDLALRTRGRGQQGADGMPFRLNVDNSLWTQRGYPIEEAFLDTLALNYDAGVFLADFATKPDAARGSINDWVSLRTEKLIPTLLGPGTITSDTVFVLTNTVYFNASWQTKFEPSATSPAPFIKLDGSQVSVPSMHAQLFVPYAEGERYQAAALPYAGEELSFLVIVPAAGAFEAVEKQLDETFLAALDAAFIRQNLSVTLPRLDYKFRSSLRPALEALGMPTAFGDADFSGMTTRRVAINDVIHEALIRVFEGGTIAAAATAVVVGRATATMTVPRELKIDHPFLFAIVDAPSGAVLFLGRVLDPSAG